MKSNLFEYFNCTSQNDLLNKVNHKDDSVQELIELFEKEKEIQLFSNLHTIRDIESTGEFLSKEKMIPPEGTITYLALDTKNNIRKAVNVPSGTFFEDIFNQVHEPSCPRIIPIVHEDNLNNSSKPSHSLLNMTAKVQQFDMTGYEALDVFSVQEISEDQYKLYSIEGKRLSISDIDIPSEYSNISELKEFKNHPLQKLKGYNEFANHYANQLLIGKNIFDDDNDIKELLKLGQHSLNQEVITLLKIDEEYNIEDITQPYRGNINSAVMDRRTLSEELFNSSNGMIFIHNHPSGITAPSEADLKMSEHLFELSKLMNKPLYDSLIVGINVYEMSKDRNNNHKYPFIDEMHTQKTHLEWNREDEMLMVAEETAIESTIKAEKGGQLTLFEDKSKYLEIVVHSKEDCMQCKFLKKSLTNNGIPFTEVNVTTEDQIYYISNELNFTSLPVLEVKGTDEVKPFSGFRPDKVNELRALIDRPIEEHSLNKKIDKLIKETDTVKSMSIKKKSKQIIEEKSRDIS